MTTEEIKGRFAVIERQNAELLAGIAHAGFEGDIMLDPTLNHAQTFIHLADEAVVTYPQGSFPIGLAAPAIESTDRLLAACERRYGKIAVKPMAQAFHAIENLWNYSGAPLHPSGIFAKKVFDAEDRLMAAICTFNQRILDQALPARRRRGRAAGERDETLHKVRAEVVAAIRALKRKHGLSWAACVKRLRTGSAYVARMRGKSDATWIRYAKAGFTG